MKKILFHFWEFRICEPGIPVEKYLKLVYSGYKHIVHEFIGDEEKTQYLCSSFLWIPQSPEWFPYTRRNLLLSGLF